MRFWVNLVALKDFNQSFGFSSTEYRGQYSFKESIIVPGCLKKFSNSTQVSKVLFFIAKKFTGSIDHKD